MSFYVDYAKLSKFDIVYPLGIMYLLVLSVRSLYPDLVKFNILFCASRKIVMLFANFILKYYIDTC